MSDILFELGTEELPPKALNKLASQLYIGVVEEIEKAGIEFDPELSRWFASPRRLAFILNSVSEKQPDKEMQRKGPAVTAAFDENGDPKPAALGFAKSVGVAVKDLQKLKTDKGEWLVYNVKEKGEDSCKLIAEFIKTSIKKLSIPKPMRWGDNSFSFIRPVHWVVYMKDNEVLGLELFGKQSANLTRGHRFHAPDFFEITKAQSYVIQLKQKYIIVDQDFRSNDIINQVNSFAADLNAQTQIDEGLLQEVTAILELPVATLGSFDPEFLKVPAEALISSMQKHQKYFPLFDQAGKLLPKFIAFANIESKDVSQVIKGFEKVITPRLADARFFWEQDQKRPLDARFAMLEKMTFEKSLGSIADKSRRVSKIISFLAEELDLDNQQAIKVAELAKCDLLTDMVDEFPDLQGLMGGYYAEAQGESPEVSQAIKEQYKPTFSGDSIPSEPLSQALSIADKIDTICGIFAVGKKPTGNKDPFALRRATLGVIRTLQEAKLNVNLYDLIKASCAGITFEKYDSERTAIEVINFVEQRIKHYYLDQNISHDVIEAVLHLKPSKLGDAHNRILACQEFKTNTSAASLASANKRISNILKKSEVTDFGTVNIRLLSENSEKNLMGAVESIRRKFTSEVDNGEYTDAFNHLSSLADPVDSFFENVMVNAEDPDVRSNRLALLNQLHGLFSAIADISKLDV